jgi:hypothetical protein
MQSIAGIVVAAVVFASGPAASQDAGLAKFEWEARPLLVFAPERTDPLFERQTAYFAEASEGLKDRDVVWIEVVRGRAVVVDGVETPSLSASALRARFGVAASDFAVTLVGRDGGAKLRALEPITPDALFARIDAMPMGAEEEAERDRKRDRRDDREETDRSRRVGPNR